MLTLLIDYEYTWYILNCYCNCTSVTDGSYISFARFSGAQNEHDLQRNYSILKRWNTASVYIIVQCVLCSQNM